MTYYEKYRACKTEEEMIEKAQRDLMVAAIIIGNEDRGKRIHEALNRVAKEKGWM